MNMNPLKRMLKSALNKDPIDQIFWGNPTFETYQKAICSYRSMSSQQRQTLISRCLRKIEKPKQSQLILANLLLIHKLLKLCPITLPSRQPVIQESSKKQNQCQKKLISYYFGYLKLSQQQNVSKNQSLQDTIQYCDIALEKCIKTINNQMIIQHCINHSNSQVTLGVALKQIFVDLRTDLIYVTQFVDSNIKLVYQRKDQISLSLNQVYEKLIFVSRNITKITLLIKKAGFTINMPVYQFNKELNMRIQMQINSRRDQKIKFKTEKSIKSRKNIQIEQEIKQSAKVQMYNDYHSLSQIQDNQILIQNFDF